MKIREYKTADCEEMAALFYQTVHSVNAKDYTHEQLDAWATGTVDLAAWDRSFLANYTLIAVAGGTIAGFGDLTAAGYLDHLFVHKDFQSQGVATILCDRLESHFPLPRLTTQASVTAKPFFEKRGWRVVREQRVERRGILLPNFVMEKIRLD